MFGALINAPKYLTKNVNIVCSSAGGFDDEKRLLRHLLLTSTIVSALKKHTKKKIC
jgi:hypothetical protein